MWRFFQAGLVAACIQCMAVSLATLGILLAARHELINLEPLDLHANAAPELDAILPLRRLRTSVLPRASCVRLSRIMLASVKPCPSDGVAAPQPDSEAYAASCRTVDI
jgi:hypothetical protein